MTQDPPRYDPHAQPSGPDSDPPRYAAPTPSPYAAPAPGPMVVKQGQSAWMIVLMILLVVMVGLCLVSSLLNFGGGISGPAMGTGSGPLVERVVGGDEEAEDFAALIPIKGVIMEGGSGGGLLGGAGPDLLEITKRRIDQAVEGGAKALILEIDSPGGGVWASAWLHRLIVKTKEREKLPVIALMKNVAASGGYYVAAPADWIIAAPSTITGSIGVIMAHHDASELAGEKLGIRYEPFTSAPMKDTLSPFRPVRDDERAHLNEMVQQMYDEFLNVVLNGRGEKIGRDRLLALQSRILTGVQAKAAGLVDELGYTEEALAMAKQKAGVRAMRLVRYDPQPGLLDSLLSAKSTQPTLTLPGGAKVSLENSSRSQPFLYVWPGGY